MSPRVPTISVIIPTHNRAYSLRRTLDALCQQTYPVENFEVLAVADGCIDRTIEMLRSYQAPFTLNIIEQKAKGAAAARNLGAAFAKGRLLLFLDDDVVPSPPLVEAHVHEHQHHSNQVILGPYPSALKGKSELIHIQKRLWWGDKFQSLSQPHHRFTYRDMLSGNASLEAKLFDHLGGFDASIKSCGGEDYEFGARLIKAGATFTYISKALAEHYEHETTDLDRSFARLRQEGRADVQIGRCHPELRSTLGLASIETSGSLKYRTLRRLAIERPEFGDYLASRLRRILDLMERLRLRGYWLRIYRGLLKYWYWRGVGEQLGDFMAIANFLQGGLINPDKSDLVIEIDLRNGLEAAMKFLDEVRPDGVRIRYGEHIVGSIPSQPGAERLRGVHLRSILTTQLAWPLLKALVVEEAFGGANHSNDLLPIFFLQPIKEDYAQ